MSLTFLAVIVLVLTACTAGNVEPPPTIVRLNSATLQPTPAWPTAAIPPTPLPLPSPTPSPTALNLSALLATPTPWPSLAPAAPAPNPTTLPENTTQVEVTATGLNIRQGPGLDYPVIATAVQRDTFKVIGRSANGNWLHVSLSDHKTGWLSGQPAYSRVLGSLQHVPVVALPAPGQTSQPAATSLHLGGRLVFMSSSGGELYLINADGTGLRWLASGIIDPVVSSDGQQVAFTRWDGAKFGALYILNLDNGEEKVVASDIRQPKSPTWSKDGQELIISFQHGGTVDPKPECREFDPDDGFQLPNVSEIISVSRRSDGSIKICFIRVEDLQWGLRRVHLSSGQSEDLPADLYSFNPTWDPQQPWRLIYDGQRGLMQLDVDSGKLQPFTNDVRDTAPVFSPDGQKLALTYKQHDHWEVYTYDLATGMRQRLTKPPLLANPQYNSAAPAWSPDGFGIAFVTDRSGKWEIWVMNADGSEQRPMFSPELQAQLGLEYRGVNERMLNWLP